MSEKTSIRPVGHYLEEEEEEEEAGEEEEEEDDDDAEGCIDEEDIFYGLQFGGFRSLKFASLSAFHKLLFSYVSTCY